VGLTMRAFRCHDCETRSGVELTNGPTELNDWRADSRMCLSDSQEQVLRRWRPAAREPWEGLRPQWSEPSNVRGLLRAGQWHITPRQAEILELVWSGLSDKQIANRLHIGNRTVRSHLEILRRRWRQPSRVGLIRVWHELKAEQSKSPQRS
jgi:DNA-binding NarL/FixJ family response regulator